MERTSAGMWRRGVQSCRCASAWTCAFRACKSGSTTERRPGRTLLSDRRWHAQWVIDRLSATSAGDIFLVVLSECLAPFVPAKKTSQRPLHRAHLPFGLPRRGCVASESLIGPTYAADTTPKPPSTSPSAPRQAAQHTPAHNRGPRVVDASISPMRSDRAAEPSSIRARVPSARRRPAPRARAAAWSRAGRAASAPRRPARSSAGRRRRSAAPAARPPRRRQPAPR